MPKVSTRTNGRPSAIRERRQAVHDDHRLARASPPARWRCPTPSPPRRRHSARRRCGPRRWRLARPARRQRAWTVERLEQRVGQMRRPRDDELHAWHLRGDERQRGREHRHRRAQLVRAASGQQRHGWRSRIEAVGAAGTRRAWPRTSIRSTSGWPTNSTGMPSRSYTATSNGKIGSTCVDEPLHRLDAPRPPRPELRADVIHDRYAQPVDGGRQPEVEVGKVDGDEDVRAFAHARGATSRRYIPYDGGSTRMASVSPVTAKPAVVADQRRAGGSQPLAAEAADSARGIAAQQFAPRARRRTGRRTPRRRKSSPCSCCRRRPTAAGAPRRARGADAVARRRRKSAAVRSRSGRFDDLEVAEADALQLLDEALRVAHEHDRQPIGPEVLPRHALDVVRRDGVDPLAVVLDLARAAGRRTAR